MFQYKISIDKKIIAILGPHLYGDTATIIAELISNSYDADAENCWVTIRTGPSPEVIIEDDGIGMTPEEVNTYFLDIGYDRRIERPVTLKGRGVFGRKGIGKLAAFSLAKRIELYSLKDNEKAGCVLDYERITQNNEEPEAVPEDEILFEPDRLSQAGTGTRIVLRSIQKNINTTYFHLVNRIVRNFNVDLDTFEIHLAKNEEPPRTVNYADLDFFQRMDTIVTIGDEYSTKAAIVGANDIPEKYKKVFTQEELGRIGNSSDRFPQLPRVIQAMDKAGQRREIQFEFSGWVGTIVNKGELRGLVYKEGANEEEADNISISDNRITIFSRKRIGEYDVLPKVQSDTIYDAYIIGEVHADMFEDDELVDMAISNRRGYEETDERYKAVIDDLRLLVTFIVQRKAEVQTARRTDVDREESDQLKRAFAEKTQTMSILKEKLDEGERETVVDENFQFMRAARLAQSTKRILISHDSENKDYGFFIMRIFELLGIDIDDAFIFTSHAPTGVPHGRNIYDYLKDCFREDIYVIFIFSRHFYDSNVCIAETGAAWATNRTHTNVVVDIRFRDIDRPIDNAENSFRIGDLDGLDTEEAAKFVERVYSHIGIDTPSRDKISDSIRQAVDEFRASLGTDSFYPKRKYQGHPICDRPGCGNTMDLKRDTSGLYYECRTPGCANRVPADIY